MIHLMQGVSVVQEGARIATYSPRDVRELQISDIRYQISGEESDAAYPVAQQHDQTKQARSDRGVQEDHHTRGMYPPGHRYEEVIEHTESCQRSEQQYQMSGMTNDRCSREETACRASENDQQKDTAEQEAERMSQCKVGDIAASADEQQ